MNNHVDILKITKVLCDQIKNEDYYTIYRTVQHLISQSQEGKDYALLSYEKKSSEEIISQVDLFKKAGFKCKYIEEINSIKINL